MSCQCPIPVGAAITKVISAKDYSNSLCRVRRMSTRLVVEVGESFGYCKPGRQVGLQLIIY